MQSRCEREGRHRGQEPGDDRGCVYGTRRLGSRAQVVKDPVCRSGQPAEGAGPTLAEISLSTEVLWGWSGVGNGLG